MAVLPSVAVEWKNDLKSEKNTFQMRNKITEIVLVLGEQKYCPVVGHIVKPS